MRTYTLPSPFDGINILCCSSGYFLATVKCFDAYSPNYRLWVVVTPFLFVFCPFQGANKSCLVVVVPCSIVPASAGRGFGAAVHWQGV